MCKRAALGPACLIRLRCVARRACRQRCRSAIGVAPARCLRLRMPTRISKPRVRRSDDHFSMAPWRSSHTRSVSPLPAVGISNDAHGAQRWHHRGALFAACHEHARRLLLSEPAHFATTSNEPAQSQFMLQLSVIIYHFYVLVFKFKRLSAAVGRLSVLSIREVDKNRLKPGRRNHFAEPTKPS